MPFELDAEHIAAENRKQLAALEEDYAHLGRQLARRGVDIERITERAMAFRVAVPSWGLGTGGTRFARFPGPGEPRNVFEKLDDCETDPAPRARHAGDLAAHPVGRARQPGRAAAFAAARGLFIDSMNSNTFQDQPGQKLSYKFGSLSHTDPAVAARRSSTTSTAWSWAAARRARAHGLDRRRRELPGPAALPPRARALPRQPARDLRGAARRLRMFIEHKLYEPSFYSTVLNDWGTSYYCTRELGERRCRSSTSATTRPTSTSR